MDYCYLCNKKLRFWNNVYIDGLYFCGPCANNRWPQERKKRILSVIYEGTPPEEHVRIEKVSIIYPNNDKWDLLGHLVLMNKGICFIQLAECERGGLITTIISNPSASAWAKAKTQGSLKELLEYSPRLILHSPDSFDDIHIKKGMLGVELEILPKGPYSLYRDFYLDSKVDHESLKISISAYLKRLASGDKERELINQKSLIDSSDKHTVKLSPCIKCECTDFEYDPFSKEYNCNKCGWIIESKQKGANS